ncbi:MAG: hypothetical protein V4864_24160 [Pseudomonadota bacterium]
MPRSQAPARSRSWQQPAAGQPDTARESASSPLDNSPRLAAQRRQIQSLFGPMAPGDAAGAPAAAGGVLQGFFELLPGQRTNDEDQFVEGAEQPVKEAQVWGMLKPAVEAAWKLLPGHHFNEALVDQIRGKLLAFAFSKKRATVEEAAQLLEAESVRRILAAEAREAELAESRKPLEDRASPAGVGGTLNTTPALAGKDKHSTASYTRTTPGVGSAEATVTTESFSSDDYTKGPAKRRRAEKPATTPAGTKQAWTKKQVDASITAWACDAPLARHLARTVWPLLANTEEGRKWELKFREIDRLIAYRDAEGQSRSIEIWKKAPKEKVRSLDRHAYNKEARQELKKALLAGTKHPADQQEVLFYDTLLRRDVDEALLADGAAFALKPAYMAAGEGGLSMILTHWRPILFFDWILAEDVLNNAS